MLAKSKIPALLSWGVGIGYLVTAGVPAAYFLATQSIYAVPAILGGGASFFMPLSVILLLGFRKRLTTIEKLLAALPLIVFVLNLVLALLVMVISPPGMHLG
jgi:hypothetical protein